MLTNVGSRETLTQNVKRGANWLKVQGQEGEIRSESREEEDLPSCPSLLHSKKEISLQLIVSDQSL